MTLTSTLSRITQIEQTFAQLAPAPSQEAIRNAASSRDFAQALSAVASPAAPGPVAATAPPTVGGVAAHPFAVTTPAVFSPQVTTQSASTSAMGERIVASAKQHLGLPYVWGGNGPADGGFDCSGLVRSVFAEHGIDLPRVARQQMHEGTEVPSLDQARPGDLIVTRGGGHIGIYTGDGQMLHAPQPGRTVEIRPLQDGEITTIRRVIA